MLRKLSVLFGNFLITVFCSYLVVHHVSATPLLRNIDIWGDDDVNNSAAVIKDQKDIYRYPRVLNFFPVPVEDECPALDGRRKGLCMNTYECRIQGGASSGPCALGFGVCCIFTATCGYEVINNITYFVNPDFPDLSRDMTSCELKVKKIDPEIAQLRLDFIHFHLGQPNRRTGVCDEDLFLMSGGNSKDVKICGLNSGQHIYYDVENVNEPITITMKMSKVAVARLWEVRVLQVPFTERAPAGCTQLYTGERGIIQTMNFAENGRRLANQKYNICIRQEVGMCSIAYEPCHENAFRIGSGPRNTTTIPRPPSQLPNGQIGGANPGQFPVVGGGIQGGPGAEGDPIVGGEEDNLEASPSEPEEVVDDGIGAEEEPEEPADGGGGDPGEEGAGGPGEEGADEPGAEGGGEPGEEGPAEPGEEGAGDPGEEVAGDPGEEGAGDPGEEGAEDPGEEGAGDPGQEGGEEPPEEAVENDEMEDVGSGDGEAPAPVRRTLLVRRRLPIRRKLSATRRKPTKGKKSPHRKFIPSSYREFREACPDRIVLPCDSDDFLTLDGNLESMGFCDIAHCGNSLCPPGNKPCRIESAVTPFTIGVHFGDPIREEPADDNIGMCLRYEQLPCV